MTQLSIKLPAKLEAKARARAVQGGHDTLDSYLKSLVIEDIDEYLDPKIEQLLIERLDDPRPDIEATPEFWKNLHARIQRKVAKQSKGKKK